jgi:hypothetical protein
MSEATKTKPPRGPAAGQPESGAAGGSPSLPPLRGSQVSVDDRSIAAASYANFCRVTGTPEELIIDFGLNAQPFGVPSEAVHINQRIVTNYFTAKRLLHALHLSVQRHEQAFGVLETDVNKRVIAQPQG